MTDDNTPLSSLKKQMNDFVTDRGWQNYHQPKNLATSILIEAGELIEHFQWDAVESGSTVQANPEKMQGIREEMADVLAYLLSLANSLDIDLTEAFEAKMQKNADKYAIDDCLAGKYNKTNNRR